ncbi:MAG TPA: hypothetical protein PLD73_00355 [Candidatus Hydrogenedentes bacterium]|jgi:hypothetical protein|nr:hypothetical protein [Candidatus Hydrogenedentota bacterium]
MAITLNGLLLDEMLTSIQEQHEEVGGRDARTVKIAGVLLGETSVAALEARLDAVLHAASAVDYSAALSIRPGRRLMVRRAAFRREIQHARLVGMFTLKLEARDPFEEAESLTEIAWPITASPSSLLVNSGGTACALPRIMLTAAGALVRPTFSDGVQCLEYDGIVKEGSFLEFDTARARATLDGEDVTPYTWGAFPRLEPGETTLTYTDQSTSSHQAAATVAFRERWW